MRFTIALITARVLFALSILLFVASVVVSLGNIRPIEGSVITPDHTINREIFDFAEYEEEDHAMLFDRALDRIDADLQRMARYRAVEVVASDYLALASLFLIAAYLARVSAIPKPASSPDITRS